MQRKRELEHFKQKANNYYIIQKGINFSVLNRNKKIENIKLQDKSENARVIPQSNSINFKKNYKKLFFVEKTLNKSNSNDKNKMQNTADDMEDKLDKKEYSDLNSSNEIKVFKNKKIVYINSNLLNSSSTSRDIEKIKDINFITRRKTTSLYRGVSKNWSKWQVIIMINNKRYYFGSYPTEEYAARVYDILALKNFGIKAKTNFVYNNNQIKQIIEKKINIKCGNLSELMKEINS